MTTMSASSRITAPYVNGMGIAWASNTTLTVAAGQCSDSSNNFDIKFNSALTLNSAVVGANGIDSGTVAVSTVYSIYAIWQQTGHSLPAVLMSTSATPILPQGYDMYRRIGYWTTTSGTANFAVMYQFGTDSTRCYEYDAPVSVLSAGTSGTYAAVSLATAVPAISTMVKFNAGCAPTAAGNTGVVRPSGSASTTYRTVNGAVAATIQWCEITVPSLVVSSAAKVDYLVTGALTLLVAGFEDNL